jgi:hypothetical protein
MTGFISTSVTGSLLITINTALSLIYTLPSPLLHTHWDSQSSLVVSWQRISTQKLELQITMKSSCLQSQLTKDMLHFRLCTLKCPALSWTLFRYGFVSLTRGFSAITDIKRPTLSPINLRHVRHRKHLL